MPLIRITHCSHDDFIPLTLGERSLKLHVNGDPARGDGLSDVPDGLLPVLDDSHISYEIVTPEAADEAGEELGGGTPGASPATTENEQKAPAPPAKKPAKPKAKKAPAKKKGK